MYVTKHAKDKVRVIRTLVSPAELQELEDAILDQAQSKTDFDVIVPLASQVLDLSHDNWEYRDNLKAVVRGNALVTVYFS